MSGSDVQAQRRGVWWYRVYRTYGRAAVAVETVARFVQRHRLNDSVLSVRVERQASQEFLLALTLESEQWGELPEDLEDLLTECAVLVQPLPGTYRLSEIQGFLSGELQVRALGQCLEYRQLKREAFEDPFEVEARVAARDEAVPDGAAERLLWFLSSAGSGTWSSLRAACTALGVPDGTQAGRLARHLRLLGHLELLDRGRWVVPPPAVARIRVDGRDLRFLVGARDASSAPDGTREQQPGGPDRVVLPVDAAAGNSADLDSPGEALATALPDLAVYRTTLTPMGSMNPQLQKLRLYDGQRFTVSPYSGQSGLYELTLPDGRTRHVLHHAGTWSEGEFYTLRFLALQAAGLLDPWRYETATSQLAVRLDGRLPERYERALVLCSGQLPEHRGGWLVYRNVPMKVAALLSVKLDVPLDLRDLE